MPTAITETPVGSTGENSGRGGTRCVGFLPFKYS